MRHKNSGRKFDRNSSHRRAMLRNLTANLVLHERIQTTDAKAKELRKLAERLATEAHRWVAVEPVPLATTPCFDGERLAIRRPAPKLGEHTAEIRGAR